MVHSAAMPYREAGQRHRGGRLLLLALAAFVCCLAMAAPLLRAAPVLAAQERTETAADHFAVAKASDELQQTASLFVTMLKAIGALALVLGLIALLTLWLRKMGLGKDAPGRGGSLIQVLDTRMLAPKKYVAVLRIADEFVAVGITDQQINLLTRLEPGEALTARLAARQAGSPALGSFAAILARARKSGGAKGPTPS